MVLKKKQKQNIAIAAIAGIILIVVIGYNYSVDQTKIKGRTFGNEIEQLQNDLTELHNEFETKLSILREDGMSNEEFLDFAGKHLEEMEELVYRYDSLEPPEPFEASVELLKLSTETQIEAEKITINWVKTGDDSEMIRVGDLTQEAFEYELAGIASFNEAKQGLNP